MSKPKFQISCEAQNNKAVVRIDGYISNWNDVAANFKAQVDSHVAQGIKDLEVYINSQGGSVFEANEIANVLAKFIGSKTAVLGALCASAATYIATKCDKVIASSNTSYMIHKPAGVIEGNADEIEAQLKLLKNLQEDYAKAYSKKTGLSVAEIEALWKEDYWMNTTEALAKKFIDEVDGNTTATLSTEQITAVNELGYKNIPSLTATVINTPNQNQMKDKLLLILAAMPGFNLTAQSSETEVVAYVENLKAKALLADQLQAKLDAATKAQKQAEIDAVITSGLANKQFTAAQEAYYRKQLSADFEGTKAHIEALPKVVALSTTLTTEVGAAASTEDRSKWTYKDYQEKNPKALAELAEKDEAKFKALFKAEYGVDC